MAVEATVPIKKYWKLYEFTGYILGKMSKWTEVPEEWWDEYNGDLYEGGVILDGT